MCSLLGSSAGAAEALRPHRAVEAGAGPWVASEDTGDGSSHGLRGSSPERGRRAVARARRNRIRHWDPSFALRVDVTHGASSSHGILVGCVQADMTAAGAPGLVCELAAGEIAEPGTGMPEPNASVRWSWSSHQRSQVTNRPARPVPASRNAIRLRARFRALAGSWCSPYSADKQLPRPRAVRVWPAARGRRRVRITSGSMKGARLVHPRPDRCGGGRRPGWPAAHPGCDGLAVNAAELNWAIRRFDHDRRTGSQARSTHIP
jgi:hypothetical protein